VNILKFLTCIGYCLWLVGCASTTVEISGPPSAPRQICQARDEQISALIIWGPVWRSDQKEVALREEVAQRGIEQFFSHSGCFSNVHVRRLTGDRSTSISSDLELLKLAESETPVPDRVVLIKVKELGPVLRIGLPVLVEGGTEVVLELKALDVRAHELITALGTHWQNGGPFVIKGVKTLEQDIAAALAATLAPR
jgi:hypothetical protein